MVGAGPAAGNGGGGHARGDGQLPAAATAAPAPRAPKRVAATTGCPPALHAADGGCGWCKDMRLPEDKYPLHCLLDGREKAGTKDWGRARYAKTVQPYTGYRLQALLHVHRLMAARPCTCATGAGRHKCKPFLKGLLGPSFQPRSDLKVNCVFFRAQVVEALSSGQYNLPGCPKLHPANKKDLDIYLDLMAKTLAEEPELEGAQV